MRSSRRSTVRGSSSLGFTWQSVIILSCPRIEGELAEVEESGSVSWSQSVTIKTEEDSNETQDL